MSIKLKTALRLLLIFIFCLFILNLIRNLWGLWYAGGRVEKAQEKLDKLRIENAKLGQEKRKLESGDFLEEQARNKLFMARENEVVLILPRSVPQASGEAVFNEGSSKVEEKEIWREWLEVFW